METEVVGQPVAEDRCQLVAAQRRQQQQIPLIFVQRRFPTRDECRQRKPRSRVRQMPVKRRRKIVRFFLFLSHSRPFCSRGRQNGYFKTRITGARMTLTTASLFFPFLDVMSERAVSPRNGYFCLIWIQSGPKFNQSWSIK